MSALKRLKADFEVKFANNAPEGTFSGYASVFDYEDFGGDVIKKGAFVASLRDWKAKNKLPKMLLQHGGGFFGGSAEDMLPIGVWTDMYEDSKGLYVQPVAAANSNSAGDVILQDNRTINIGSGVSADTVEQLKAELERDRALRKEQVIGIVAQARKERRL